MTEQEAMAACPFRSLIVMHPGAPVLGVWAIVEGPATPIPAHVDAELRIADARGGNFLVIARKRKHRDAAKAEVLLRYGAGGRA